MKCMNVIADWPLEIWRTMNRTGLIPANCHGRKGFIDVEPTEHTNMRISIALISFLYFR